MIKYLTNLCSADYEHEYDKQALEKLRNFPVMTSVMNFILNWSKLKWYMAEQEGGSLRITPQSCPKLYQQIVDIAKTLDLDRLPRTYCDQSYLINAATTGYKEMTMLCLNTGSIDLLDENELRFVIGHEMGHIKSGHVIYHQMVWYLGDIVENVSLLKPLLLPFRLALLYWYRMSEFTADRAGLLACQDVNAAIRAFIKMSGLPTKYYNDISVDAYIKQADDFEKDNEDFFDRAIKDLSLLDDTHPWMVLRAKELLKWASSEQYKQLIAQ